MNKWTGPRNSPSSAQGQSRLRNRPFLCFSGAATSDKNDNVTINLGRISAVLILAAIFLVVGALGPVRADNASESDDSSQQRISKRSSTGKQTEAKVIEQPPAKTTEPWDCLWARLQRATRRLSRNWSNSCFRGSSQSLRMRSGRATKPGLMS